MTSSLNENRPFGSEPVTLSISPIALLAIREAANGFLRAFEGSNEMATMIGSAIESISSRINYLSEDNLDTFALREEEFVFALYNAVVIQWVTMAMTDRVRATWGDDDIRTKMSANSLERVRAGLDAYTHNGGHEWKTVYSLHRKVFEQQLAEFTTVSD
jgi:hypothetical protein